MVTIFMVVQPWTVLLPTDGKNFYNSSCLFNAFISSNKEIKVLLFILYLDIILSEK